MNSSSDLLKSLKIDRSAPPPPTSHKGLWIGLGVAAVVVLGAGGAWLALGRDKGVEVQVADVVAIGNGGAARAARWALADRGVITAARRGGDVTMDQLPQAARQCRVVVNATPLGMEGFPPFADLSFLGSLPAGAAVFDLIYAPRKTELYQAARARGLIAITGMELLVQQAILAFNHFTGAGLEQEATRRELLALVNET